MIIFTNLGSEGYNTLFSRINCIAVHCSISLFNFNLFTVPYTNTHSHTHILTDSHTHAHTLSHTYTIAHTHTHTQLHTLTHSLTYLLFLTLIHRNLRFIQAVLLTVSDTDLRGCLSVPRDSTTREAGRGGKGK